MVTGQRLRWVAQKIRYHQLEEPLSQLGWLTSVGVFARWTQFHYHAPAGGVLWVGMTIRTSVFALWGQVAREWLAIRWRHPSSQQDTQDRGEI